MSIGISLVASSPRFNKLRYKGQFVNGEGKNRLCTNTHRMMYGFFPCVYQKNQPHLGKYSNIVWVSAVLKTLGKSFFLLGG